MSGFMGHEPDGKPGQPKTVKEWVFTLDHKVIGVWYLIGAIASFVVAGLAASAMRLELGSVGPDITDNGDIYNLWLTMHGAVMILGFQIPALLGFVANWAVPIMVGGKDMAFPRVNAMSVWLLWSGIILALMNLVIPDSYNGMWTGYPPYSLTDAVGNTAMYSSIVIILGMSSVFGAVNLACTVAFMRCKGMGWFQMPLTVWCVFTANVIQLIFVPVLAASVLLLSLDKYLGFGFYNPEVGGDVLLYQNLFWFYSHPAVYVILLPFMGIMFEIFAVSARNDVFNYKATVWSVIAFIPVSSDVWVHHAYVAGLPDWLRLLQTFTTLLISLPFGLLMLSLTGTLFRGTIRYTGPMYWAVGAFLMLIIGALTGIPNALSAVDYGISDSYVIMSHFHYVMAVSGGMAIFAGVFYWFPKLTGRMCNTAMTKLTAVGFFIGMNIVMGPLYFAGIEGMPRRYMDYAMFENNATIVDAQHWSTIGLYITFVSALLMIVTWLQGAIAGEKATSANPWGAESLEFTATAIIPGQGNFPTPVICPEGWHPYNFIDNPKPEFEPHPGTSGHH
ncbi:cytochrome c oxidase subunit I [Mariprofundus micogutta]|uniref:Cytochrome c oxidase subunit I n=1 Tax=Mariprofundus micogutta TaxID=1921010 RepID=A0A1L8CKI3_9PROT|nr:cbb3-type cytochrome c oxidase subunit I [Mariprofundus micogutta]GAV19395.1 cytochrome c oxidase subunit I [Mariprofundus micogutta]